MRVRTDLPVTTRMIQNLWIPLADGTRLAARAWLPEDAYVNPVPAVLEYIPYRKGDHQAVADSRMHAYFAGHGYASVRVDLRGAGDSDGTLADEYLVREQDDAVEVIAWLAEQVWCSGRVGMLGISWGGFNSLQVAARRPAALAAVISVASTDDRYADDVHYMGGCIIGNDMPVWATMMLGMNAMPPDPATVGERWREMWLERLEANAPVLETWLAHQRRDDYWKHGSVCEDYEAIDCAVYMVGGWADGYTNAIPRFLSRFTGPRKGLIGPWGHTWPQRGAPGPAIGFLQEAVRWWDHWLKEIDAGMMDEPMLRVWMQEWAPPRPTMSTVPGRWVAERSWPSERIQRCAWELAPDGSLTAGSAPDGVMTVSSVQSHGLEGGLWLPYGVPSDFPADQRPEDGRALCFDSEPLTEELELLGVPELVVELSTDRPHALLAARLCDVAPDGSSLLISRGLLNLCHRDSHEHPSTLEPGRPYSVRMGLNALGCSVSVGHRLRLALSPCYWPIAWPSPEPATLSFLLGGASRLELPIRPVSDVDQELAPFGDPEEAPGVPVETLRHLTEPQTLTHNRDEDSWTLQYPLEDQRWRLPASAGLEFTNLLAGGDTFRIVEGDPLSAEARRSGKIELRRDEWRVRINATCALSADIDSFHVTSAVEAYEGDTRVFARTWTAVIPRDHV